MAQKPAKKKPVAQVGGHGSKRPQREGAFIAALLTSSSLAEAASMANICLRTAQRWYSDPAFKAKLVSVQNDLVEHNLMRLKLSSSAAIGVLHAIMTDISAPSSARVAAARTLIDGTFRAVETADILTRIEKLEQTEKRRDL